MRIPADGKAMSAIAAARRNLTNVAVMGSQWANAIFEARNDEPHRIFARRAQKSPGRIPQ
jgi:hypothetical protein